MREYAKMLSPKPAEQSLINKVYGSFNDLFGTINCIQIGSYPRFTATTPIHDLDILYVIGTWDENNHTPFTVLQHLFDKISKEYVNPTPYTIKKSLQTHSVTVEFFSESRIILSVDIVPAYSYSKNEFGLNTYKVPEVIKEKAHAKRKGYYTKLQLERRDMSWIKSDPRGYIKIATNVGRNTDFRKTVKLVKRWKSNLQKKDDSLKLKSFHLEQVITKIFQENTSLEVFDAIFMFFYELPDIISQPKQTVDRANTDKYIDDYLAQFTKEHIEKIRQARDGFMIKLERFEDSDTVENLFETFLYERPRTEEFMFDKQIMTLTDPQHSDFLLLADITDKQGNAQRRLNPQGGVDSGRYLKFNKSKNIGGCLYEWKVRNDDRAVEPRGEITQHRTKNIPEHTKYSGIHYIECYAIRDGKCIAIARHNVVIP